MNIVRRVLTLTASIAILAGCGGGSKPSVVPQPAAPAAAASKANATATLTLKFPANFHHARFPVPKPKAVTVKGRTAYLTVAASARPSPKTTGATRKSPKYINPGSGNIINVYAYSNATGTVTATPSGGVVLPSNAQADGTLTFTAALPASTYDYVEVQETDANGNELAAGYDDNIEIDPGSQNTLQITMEMNAQYIVLTTDPVNGTDATVLGGSYDDYANVPFCSYNTGASPFYAFAADSTGGYVLPGSPAGGAFDSNNDIAAIPVPTLNGTYQSQLAVTPLGLQSDFLEPYATIYASFVEVNPDTNFGYGARSYGYAVIGDNGSAPCTLMGSLSEEPANANDVSVLTITGGNPPYNVTDSDQNCSVSETNPPSTLQWNVSTSQSGYSCFLSISDKNVGNSATAELDTNSAPPGPLSLSQNTICFSGFGQTQTISIFGGSGSYSVGTPTDTSVFTVGNITASSFDVTSSSNYAGSAMVTVTDTNTSEMQTLTAAQQFC